MAYWISLAGMLLFAAVVLFLRMQSPHSSAMPADPAAPQGATLTCSCEEWRRHRARFRQGDPRRLCCHLCGWLAQDAHRLPDALIPFSHLIQRMARERRGVPCTPPSFAFVLGNSGYLAALEDLAYPNMAVYAGSRRYYFNVLEGTWGAGGAPPFAEDIGSLVQTEIRRRLQQKQPAKNDDAL